MGAPPETAPEEVLRAAAAEVSTPSAKRRLRLFRHTLPPLLAKATESASDTTFLVDLIFQTLPLYDDRASRKAVDDMVIRALSESTFMKPFAATLVQSMEKNLKVTSPLACFKLLRWSIYLLKWTQFATLSKGGFSRLANAQAVLSQVLMDGSFRHRRTCKQLFIRLFSESVELYKMYIEEVRDLRISTRDSPAFINLILDFTITSSSLLSEYKPVFLDLYVKTILSSKDRPSKAASEAFKPLFLDIGHEDFKTIVLPSCIKMLKRNPEIVLQSIGLLLMTVRLDLSNYSMEFMPVILHQARHSDEERRINALNIVGTLSDKSSDPDTLPSMFNAIKAILGGSEGKLSLPYQRVGMLNALEHLSRFSPKQISRLAPSVSSFLLTCYKGDGIEEVKLAALSALGSWASVSSEAVQPDVVSFITAGLKEKDTLRKGHLKLIRVICKKSDSLTKVTSLLDHLIQLSKNGFTKATQRLDGIYALYAISRLAAIDAKADGSIVKEKLWALIAQSEPSVISVQLKGAMDLSDFEFFKIIMDVSFDRLSLPEKFAELLKGREPREMKLREADAGNDRLFVTEMVVNGPNDIFLRDGWKQFAQSYDLDIGHVLFLTYDGVNTLTVKVFEPTACRRFYHDYTTADLNTVLAKFCVFPKGVSLDDRQQTLVKDWCVKNQPKIPLYICKIVHSHIDKAKGKMYFNEEYTRTHLSNFLSTAGVIDVEIHDITNEKIGDFSMKIGENKQATITHKWLSVTTGQKWNGGDIVMFWFQRHGDNSLRLDVQKI